MSAAQFNETGDWFGEIGFATFAWSLEFLEFLEFGCFGFLCFVLASVPDHHHVSL